MKPRPNLVLILMMGPYFSNPRSLAFGLLQTMNHSGTYIAVRMIRMMTVVLVSVPSDMPFHAHYV